MIQIQTYQTNGYMKIEVKGHANYAEHGKDIVCAAVSAIMQTALLGLHSVAETYPEYVKAIETEERLHCDVSIKDTSTFKGLLELIKGVALRDDCSDDMKQYLEDGLQKLQDQPNTVT
jgi:uncharacterized protein YsxB (DUF464 family)